MITKILISGMRGKRTTYSPYKEENDNGMDDTKILGKRVISKEEEEEKGTQTVVRYA